VITGGGSYSVSTAGTCFKYVNATFVRGGMFSVEGPEGLRFLTRSRLFTDEEWAVLS